MLFQGAFQNKKVFCAMAVVGLATTVLGKDTGTPAGTVLRGVPEKPKKRRVQDFFDPPGEEDEDLVDVVEDEDEEEDTVGDILEDVDTDVADEAEDAAEGQVSEPEQLDLSVCVTRTLRQGDRLEPGEFLGPEQNCNPRQYRFGLEADGELVFRNEYETLWESGVVCDSLREQSDGNTVCYDRFGNALWATDCFGDNVNVVVDDDAVRAYDDDTVLVWRLTETEGLSQCYPDGRNPDDPDEPDNPDNDRCEDVSSRRYGDMCVLQMIDFENMYVVNIEATEEGDSLISVDFNFDNESPYNDYENYRIAVDTSDKDAFIIGQRAVGDAQGLSNIDPDFVGCTNIIRDDNYDMDENDRDELEFRRPSDYDHPCNEFAQNLIYFLVIENYFPRAG